MAAPDPQDAAASTTVGRGAELAALTGLLEGAGSGSPAVAVLRGEAGAGKTHLLDTVCARARSDGWTVLRAVGVEAETGLSGGGLLAALLPLRELVPRLPPAQAEAVSAALGWTPPTASTGDRFLVGAGTLGVLAAAAATSPVLVAVDDAQWLDEDSADALTFAARRLGHDRVATLLTVRAEGDLPPRLAGLDVIDLSGLAPADARALLGPGFSSDVAARLVDETGGNPLALRECRRVLDAAQRSGAAPLPASLPVPHRLRAVLSERLSRLPEPSRRAVLLAAASLEPAAAPVLAVLAAEGLDAAESLAGADDVLLLEDGVLTFRHPLLRSATWARASGPERRDAHAAIARVVTDPAARAWHRAEAASGHDEQLALDLAALADVERARHGIAAASRTAERAARLTADGKRRSEWLAAATDDAYGAGDTARAERLAAEVLASDAAASPRARVLLVLGMLEQAHGTLGAARNRLEQARDLAQGAVLVRTLTELFGVCHLLDDPDGMRAAADRAVDSADRSDPEQDLLASYLEGAAAAVAGRPDLGLDRLLHAIEVAESDPVLRDDTRHLVTSILIARWLMDPLPVVPYAERRISHAREQGALGVLAAALPLYAMGMVWMGEHVQAHATAGEAVELLETLDLRTDFGTASEAAALENAFRGRHDEARRHLERAGAVVAVNGFDPMPPHLARVVATCALCAGDLDRVVETLEDQVARFGGVGAYFEPLGVAPELVEAYLGLGRDDDARDLAARFRDSQSGAGRSPMTQVAAMVARCEGLVAPDLDTAVQHLERALELHDPGTDRLEAARTRLLLGMRLRRGGRRVEARTHLRLARAEFAAMDLTLWTARAAAELSATGERLQGREGTGEALTSQETRVALLVAQGMTNREVAAALFLSPKTVEHHLGAVLRKRGQRSRTELARSFTGAADAASAAGEANANGRS